MNTIREENGSQWPADFGFDNTIDGLEVFRQFEQFMRNDSNQLARLQHFKSRILPSGEPLGPELVGFFKQSVARRQSKLVTIAECWSQLIPEMLNDHCALESLNRGTLTVLVDSSSHLYELKQLLLAGLQDQVLMACRSTGLKKISLKVGHWYDPASESRAPRF